MAHRIEIRLGAFSEDDHHRVRNFVEAVWLEASKRGWAEADDFDRRVVSGAKFAFSFPARASHDATMVVEALLRSHHMQELVTVTHSKRAKVDG